MNIENMQISDYLNKLSSNSATPGGGSVAGISAAQGVALNLMVINLTLGKEKYDEFLSTNEDVKKKCEMLFQELKKAADDDKQAFSKLAAAYKLPKDTQEESNKKQRALEEASIGATDAPFEVIKKSLEGIKLTKILIGKTNTMAISDLGVAAVMFKSAAKSAWLNVKINLPYIKNEDLVNKYRENSNKFLNEIDEIAVDIYKEVEEAL